MKTSAEKINIAIIDDAKIALKGWEACFKEHKDIELIFTSANKHDFYKKCEKFAAELDVLIMDKSIDGKTQFDDFEYIKETHKRFPDIRIIVYTWDYYEGHIAYLKDLGVHAYLPNKTDENEMIAAIRRVARGELYFPANELTRQAEKEGYDGNQRSIDIDIVKQTDSLNPAESKVAAYLAHDFLKKQIADRLNVSEKTIEKHITGIYRKLNIEHGHAHTRTSFILKYGGFFRQKYPNIK